MANKELGRLVGESLGKSTELATIVFALLAQTQALDDTTITEHADIFPVWDENLTGKEGTIVSVDGILYRATKDFGKGELPKESDSWKAIGNPKDEFPNWSQPLGAHDAYKKGAKVAHNGKVWISELNSNVWEPGVYGWVETKKEERNNVRKD